MIARINRFSILRAAERALKPSVRRRRELPSASLGRELLFRLGKLLQHAEGEELRRRTAPPAASELIRIDCRLDLCARQLRAATDRAPLPQLRSTLPFVALERRDEAMALLDLCLEEDQPVATRLPLIDYLITLLTTRTVGYRKSLEYDPTQASVQVTRRCMCFAEEDEEISRDIELTFLKAAREATTLDHLENMVRRMRTYKAELDELIFIPRALRSMVEYNVAVDNRIRVLLDRDRERTRASENALSALQALDDIEDDELRERRNEPVSSALDAPALIALDEALCDLLAGYEVPESPAAKLAGSFQTTRFADHEARAFTDPEAGLEQVTRLLRLTVVAGLTCQALPAMSDALRALRLEPRVLTEHWIPELSRQLDTTIEQLTIVGQMELANQLRRSQEKYLTG